MPVEVKLRKTPHHQQKVFIDCDAPEQLYGGAKRGGKSVALAMKVIMLLVYFPGNRGLLARLNLSDLRDTTLNEFFQVCPPELILEHNKTERRIKIASVDARFPSELLYRGIGDPDDFEKIKSLNLGFLAIDEPSEVPLETYLMLRAQLTWQLADGTRPPYMCLLASNPEPGWVEDRFIVNETAGCVFIPGLPKDNPFLPDGYEAELRRSYPTEWVKKYLDGAWGASEGAIFKSFDPDVHDLDIWLGTADDDQTKFNQFMWGLNLVPSHDYAATGYVACTLNGADAFGNLFVCGEHYANNRLFSEHATDIKNKLYFPYLTRLLPGTGSVQTKRFLYELVDPSVTQRTQQGANDLQAIADEYRRNGFNVIPAWNALELGYTRMQEHFHILPTHRHPFNGRVGSPSLFVSRTRCPETWKDIRSIKKKILPDGRVEYIGRDHGLDTVRYFVLSQPRRAELEKLDEQFMTQQELFSKRAHDKWAQGWGKKDPTNRWFAGMGAPMGIGSGRIQ